METFIHLANGTFLASFLVRDILKLRLLSIAGGAFLLVYFLGSVPIVWPSVGWNVLFACINGLQVVRLLLERRPVRMSEDEHELHRVALGSLSPRQLRTIAKAARFESIREGEVLVHAGRMPDELDVVLEGEVAVEHDGEPLARLGTGKFIGEMSFLTRTPPRASALVCSPGVRVARLDVRELRQMLDADHELHAAMQAILGGDLAAKLRAAARGPER
jgi:CRP-like cAMP-binding protein